MKKLLLAGVALSGLMAAGAASAADLPARTAPAPVAVPVVPLFTWTGFYVGANAGYGWHDGNNDAIFVPAGALVTAPAATGFIANGGDDNGDGFVGGGQVGYNYQFGAFVVGVEADIQWADLGGSNDDFVLVPAGFGTFVPAGVSGGLDWFGTVRARLGFAFDRALVYATGGFAYGGADTGNSFNGLVNNDDTRGGWAVGGGVDYAITNNLIVGLEGLWVSLEGDNNGTFIGTETLPGGTVRVVNSFSTRNDDNDFFVARAKLNYKF